MVQLDDSQLVSLLRKRAWRLILAALATIVVHLLVVWAVSNLLPAVLTWLDKPDPGAALNEFLAILVVTYLMGALALYVPTARREQLGWLWAGTFAILAILVAFLLIVLLRSFHVRTLDIIWSLMVFAGYFAHVVIYHLLNLNVMQAVPSEKIMRLAPRLGLSVIEKPDLASLNCNRLVIDTTHRYSAEWTYFLARASLTGVRITDVSNVYEEVLGRVYYQDKSLFLSGSTSLHTFYAPLKTILELLIILVAIPLWVPALLIAMLLIKLEDGGPIFYVQERMGRFGKDFSMIKLRSMRVQDNTQDFLTTSDDERITRIGRFIRKYRIDELPQLYNILRGEMSLIGPRAEWRHVLEYHSDTSMYELRHLVRPGITGWAQVRQGYVSTPEDGRRKLEYDLYYVRHMSLILDIVIVVRTLGIMFTGFGGR